MRSVAPRAHGQDCSGRCTPAQRLDLRGGEISTVRQGAARYDGIPVCVCVQCHLRICASGTTSVWRACHPVSLQSYKMQADWHKLLCLLRVRQWDVAACQVDGREHCPSDQVILGLSLIGSCPSPHFTWLAWLGQVQQPCQGGRLLQQQDARRVAHRGGHIC